MSAQGGFPHFLERKVSDIRPGHPLPCDLYVETLSEKRLIKLHGSGEILSCDRYRLFREKKVRSIWIPESAQKDFEDYLIRLIPEKKDAAHCLVQSLVDAQDEDEKNQAWAYAANLARGLAFPEGKPSETFNLWVEAASSEVPGTAFRIATFAILYACAVQDFEPALLADLALACLSTSADRAPPRVVLWLEQRFERFDGSGHPKGLKGFEIDDISQLLAISDIVEEVFNGMQSKPLRSLDEARQAMEALNAKPPFPQLFNPDLFFALISKVFGDERESPGKTANKAA